MVVGWSCVVRGVVRRIGGYSGGAGGRGGAGGGGDEEELQAFLCVTSLGHVSFILLQCLT